MKSQSSSFLGEEPHPVVRITIREHFPSSTMDRTSSLMQMCIKKGRRLTSIRHSVPSVPVSRAFVCHRVLHCDNPRTDIESNIANETWH